MSAVAVAAADTDADTLAAALRRRVSELRAVALAAGPLDRLAVASEIATLERWREVVEVSGGDSCPSCCLAEARRALGLF